MKLIIVSVMQPHKTNWQHAAMPVLIHYSQTALAKWNSPYNLSIERVFNRIFYSSPKYMCVSNIWTDGVENANTGSIRYVVIVLLRIGFLLTKKVVNLYRGWSDDFLLNK